MAHSSGLLRGLQESGVEPGLLVRFEKQNIETDGQGAARCNIIDEIGMIGARPLLEPAQFFQTSVVDIDDDNLFNRLAAARLLEALDPLVLAPTAGSCLKNM